MLGSELPGHVMTDVNFSSKLQIFSEVYVREPSYAGVHNDLYKDWDPYMKAMGYERRSNHDAPQYNEDDAFYVRIGEE